MKERKKIKQALWQRPELIKRLFSDTEWQSFSTADRLENAHSEELLSQIQSQLVSEQDLIAQKHLVWRFYWPGIKAMAATFIPLFFALALWRPMPGETELHTSQSYKPSPAVNQWHTIYNSSKERLYQALPDSSTVFLYPESSLKYLENLTSTDRTIYLEGKALFIVKKDPSRPFNVYAGGIKTTALGTSFTIDTKGKINQTSVKLHTGKVQLQSLGSARSFSRKILLPGQSFVFNRLTHKEINVKKRQLEMEKTSFEKAGQLLHFKNMHLNLVFEVLEEEYTTHIDVKATKLATSITYTGEVDLDKETIEQILERICLLNGLQMARSATGDFIINTSEIQNQQPLSNNKND